MRYFEVCAFILITSVSAITFFHFNYHLYAINIATIGVRNTLDFYQNLPKILKVELDDDDVEDGADSDDRNIDDHDDNDNESNETDQHITPMCSTWAELRKLVLSMFKRVRKVIRISSDKQSLSELFADELKYIDIIIENFCARLLGSSKKEMHKEGLKNEMLDKITTELKAFQDDIKKVSADHLDKIDYADMKSNQMFILTTILLLQRFKQFLDHKKDEYLDCSCQVAQKFYSQFQENSNDLHQCWNWAEEQYGNIFNTTKTDLNLYSEVTFEIVNEAEQHGRSSYVNYLKLPAEVCNLYFFFVISLTNVNLFFVFAAAPQYCVSNRVYYTNNKA